VPDQLTVSRPSAADAYPHPIDLRRLRRGVVNRHDAGEGVEVAVVWQADQLRVFREICPHMGGPLGQASLCAGGTALECPWHGYVFDLETGRLRENPNEQIMAPLRRPSACFRPDRTPKYVLTLLPYRIVGTEAWVLRKRSVE
jgi:nitrite reductase/ring-hydroxylating ferredoxin subunit